MRIDEHYTLTQDGYNFILSYEETKDEINPKTGKNIVSKEHWYYKDAKDALMAYKNKSANYNVEVDAILHKLNEIDKTISGLMLK